MNFFCCLRGTWGGEIGVGDIARPDVGVSAVVLPDGKREEENIGNHDYKTNMSSSDALYFVK
jgi:hypothetical protein